MFLRNIELGWYNRAFALAAFVLSVPFCKK